MPDASTTSQRLRLSSREYSGRDKVAALRELFGRELMRLELWPCKGAVPLDFTATLMPLGVAPFMLAASTHLRTCGARPSWCVMGRTTSS